MGALLEYVKSFLALFLLIKILLYLAPKKIFSGYISFFSGVILALGMLYPILKLFYPVPAFFENKLKLTS